MMLEQVQPIVGEYTALSPVCKEHDPRATEVARRLIVEIARHLPEIRTEHVGSTAAPGCAGKGIVDLMIPVPAGKMDAVKELLDRLGFQRQGGPEPFGEDRPMRVGSLSHDNTTFQIHVHVIPAESSEVDEMRFFRSCLRGDPDLMKAYVAQKRQILANGVADSLEYCKAKGEFLKMVLG
jgi:dephospho-CoA kinase